MFPLVCKALKRSDAETDPVFRDNIPPERLGIGVYLSGMDIPVLDELYPKMLSHRSAVGKIYEFTGLTTAESMSRSSLILRRSC